MSKRSIEWATEDEVGQEGCVSLFDILEMGYILHDSIRKFKEEKKERDLLKIQNMRTTEIGDGRKTYEK